MYLLLIFHLLLLFQYPYSNVCEQEVNNSHNQSEITDTDPFEEKMTLLDELNRARANPKEYGYNVGVDLSGFKPMNPLVWDMGLGIEAQKLSDWQYKNVELKHTDNLTRMESLCWSYDVKHSISQFLIDKNVPSLGHRYHLLDKTQMVVGIGVTHGKVGKFMRVYVVILSR